jgi:hypothetical protein
LLDKQLQQMKVADADVREIDKRIDIQLAEF